ncbi:MAG: phosphoribosyl-AMP cyclohydrolase [Rhizobiaceae bacterium]|nr:phosphoribosyl-AMP cyclohydrolase [Rhizobiaceae bacterium]
MGSEQNFPPPGNKQELEQGTELTPKFDASGLLPAIVTNVDGGDVLMLAYMNAEALRLTLSTRKAHFWSRSRGEIWLKGETSGNVLEVVELRTDCDQDCIWIKASISGDQVACHTGKTSCFYRVITNDDGDIRLVSDS